MTVSGDNPDISNTIATHTTGNNAIRLAPRTVLRKIKLKQIRVYPDSISKYYLLKYNNDWVGYLPFHKETPDIKNIIESINRCDEVLFSRNGFIDTVMLDYIREQNIQPWL